jgi:hypothetical protein
MTPKYLTFYLSVWNFGSNVETGKGNFLCAYNKMSTKSRTYYFTATDVRRRGGKSHDVKYSRQTKITHILQIRKHLCILN